MLKSARTAWGRRDSRQILKAGENRTLRWRISEEAAALRRRLSPDFSCSRACPRRISPRAANNVQLTQYTPQTVLDVAEAGVVWEKRAKYRLK